MHISEYWWGNLNNPRSPEGKKLLLTRRELKKIERKVKRDRDDNYCPQGFYQREEGLAKAEIAVSKGKKEYDKRENNKNARMLQGKWTG